MFIFKILLIILIALPVIALGSYLYVQMISFIKDRNKAEQEMIRRSLEEPGVRVKRSTSAGRKDKRKKHKKNKKNGESRQQK